MTDLLFDSHGINHTVGLYREKAVDDITTDNIQSLFNSMTGTKSTKDKARMVLNMILEAAVEDNVINFICLSSLNPPFQGGLAQKQAFPRP